MQGVQGGSENVSILQRSCRDKNVPANIRLGFVTKVYGIVGYMLLISFGVASPFVFRPDEMKNYVFVQFPWIGYMVCGLFLAQYMINFLVVIGSCCAPSILQIYLRMFKMVPWNFLYLTVTAVTFGFGIGFVCTQYQANSVVFVFILSFFMIVALTAYAVHTNADVTGMGMYIFAALIGFMLLSLLCVFFGGPTFNNLIAGLGCMLFGFLIVYDTQLIFGSASAGGERKHEYTIDMYAFAAFQLYLDIINFFIYMLRVLGNRR